MSISAIILNWICRESINGEFLNMIDVPKEGEYEWEQNEAWWLNNFGTLPPEAIPEGRYIYYYTSQIPDEVEDIFGMTFYPDCVMELCNSGTACDYDYIYMYKL